MSITVRAAGPADEPAWEAFVDGWPGATFFHRYPWRRVLERAFGHRCHFLLAEDGGAVAGVLPLAEVRSRLFGRKLASLPFCVYGGIAAGSEAAATALRERASALARELGVEALELRHREPTASCWPVKDLYYTFRKPIAADNGANLKAIPNRQRAMLRKALKAGLYGEEDSGTARLYRVYAESLRNLGTPVFGRGYLDILRQEFGDACRVLMIRQAPGGQPVAGTDDKALVAGVAGEDGEDVAGVLSFYFRGEVLPYYGGSVTRTRDIKGCNHILYWELLRRSAEEGVTGFDFGRSKRDTGPFAFKKHFGFEPTPLPYEYDLVTVDELPDLNPNNPKYRLLVRTWQRLPLPVANLLGPPLARSLG
ncbi:GNAT family N-acetyltransferase [Pseudohaliea sp.]|uniref:GNAT family N-acetyltransferase n=1 Tax=Pseudohaliea sp. TaxID=2740289 RepID=UPI0032EA97EA